MWRSSSSLAWMHNYWLLDNIVRVVIFAVPYRSFWRTEVVVAEMIVVVVAVAMMLLLMTML